MSAAVICACPRTDIPCLFDLFDTCTVVLCLQTQLAPCVERDRSHARQWHCRALLLLCDRQDWHSCTCTCYDRSGHQGNRHHALARVCRHNAQRRKCVRPTRQKGKGAAVPQPLREQPAALRGTVRFSQPNERHKAGSAQCAAAHKSRQR